jgi:hypothetical protein
VKFVKFTELFIVYFVLSTLKVIPVPVPVPSYCRVSEGVERKGADMLKLVEQVCQPGLSTNLS